MKLVSIALLAASVMAGCGGGGDAQPQNSAGSTQLLAQATTRTQPQIGADGRPEIPSSAQTIAGADDNKNGVRDDVDRYIRLRFNEPVKAKAMTQLAAAIQNALLQNGTAEKAQEATRVWFRALQCVEQTLGESGYYESKRLTAEMLNSELRSKAYAQHEMHSGGVYDMPKGAVCDN